jgi:hypothetical protein
MYQPHDIGNIVMMLPSAWVGSRVSAAADAADAVDPPALSRVLVSVTCAAMSALGCYWLFRLFAGYWDRRTAFLLAVAFPTATIFIAYARAAWDVLGAAVMMCGVLRYSAQVLRGGASARSALLLAVTVAAACSFRFSLAPFVLPAAAVVVWRRRGSIGIRPVLLAAALAVTLLAPSLAYNFVRTGSPLRPATATAQYLAGNNALTGSVTGGIGGLFVSPNRGLFLFSPILAFMFAVPFLWRRLPLDQRVLLIVYGAASLGYVILIAKMVNWGAFGWGPRYLVPVLPVAFFAAAIGVKHAVHAYPLPALTIVALSALLSLPPAIVNWHAATTAYEGAADPYAPRPYQQIAGWKVLIAGLQGNDVLAIGAEQAGRPAAAMFPDLLLARMARHSAMGLIAATLAAACALLSAGWCASKVVRR